MLKLSMYFLLHFLQDRVIFFQPFLLISLLFTQKLTEKLWNGTMANVSSLAKSQEIYLRFTISMPSRMIKITFNYLPDSRKAFCPEPGILK